MVISRKNCITQRGEDTVLLIASELLAFLFFRGMAVPEVLVGGNHEQIRKWRRGKALEKTLHNRPDLLERQPLSKEDRKFLAEIGKKDIGLKPPVRMFLASWTKSS